LKLRGFKYSREDCLKISKALKGRLNTWCKSGKDSPNWRGGISPLAMRIRGLEGIWRKNILEKNNYICQNCGSKENLEVHHIKEFSKIFQEFLQQYPQFSPIDDKETLVRLAMTYEPFWNINNGETRCLNCHNLTHTKTKI